MKKLVIVVILFSAMLLATLVNSEEIPHIPFKTPYDWWYQFDQRGHAHLNSLDSHQGLKGLCGLDKMHWQWNFDEPFWDNHDSRWTCDFFKLDTLGFQTGHYDAYFGEIYSYSCTTKNEPAGYLFNNTVLLDHIGNLPGRYGLWIEIQKVSQIEDDTPVCSLRVNDAGFNGKSVDKTFVIRAGDLAQYQWEYHGGLVDGIFARGKNTKITLYWNGQVSMKIRNIRFMDEYTYHSYCD